MTTSKFNIYISIICLAFSSCKKNENNTTDSEQLTSGITFDVTGITSLEEETGKLSKEASSTKSQTLKSKKLLSAESSDLDAQFRAITSVTAENDDIDFKQTSSKNTIQKIAATEALATGATYRVLIYRGSQYVATLNLNNYIGNTTPSNLPQLIKGVTYTWYAYTYNTSTALPAIANNNSPTVASASDKILAWDSGSIVVDATMQKIPIVFKYKTARITFELNGINTYSHLTLGSNINITATGMNTGVLNIKTGEYDQLNTTTLTGLPMTLVSPIDSAVYRTATYNTAITETQDASATVTLNVTIPSLSLRQIYFNPTAGTLRTPIVSSNRVASFTNITKSIVLAPQSGIVLRKSKNVVARLILSQKAININSVNWAQSNIFADRDLFSTKASDPTSTRYIPQGAVSAPNLLRLKYYLGLALKPAGARTEGFFIMDNLDGPRGGAGFDPCNHLRWVGKDGTLYNQPNTNGTTVDNQLTGDQAIWRLPTPTEFDNLLATAYTKAGGFDPLPTQVSEADENTRLNLSWTGSNGTLKLFFGGFYGYDNTSSWPEIHYSYRDTRPYAFYHTKIIGGSRGAVKLTSASSNPSAGAITAQYYTSNSNERAIYGLSATNDNGQIHS